MQLKKFKNDNIIPANGYYNSSNWYVACSGQLQTMLLSLHGNRYVNYELDDPLDYDPETLVSDTLEYIKDQINALFIINNEAYTKMYDVLTLEYNPIWNYDGENTLTYTKENTGTDNVSGSNTGTDNVSGSNTGTQTHKDTTSDINTSSNTTYDSGTELEVSKNVLTHDPNGSIVRTDNLANTNNRTLNLANTNNRTVNLKEEYSHKEVKHGNQGTTTTQSMLTEEWSVRTMFNFNKMICDDIAKYVTY